MIYTRGNSAPAKTNNPSKSLVPAITCTEYCTSQEVDRGHHISIVHLAPCLPTWGKANLGNLLPAVPPNERRGTVRGKAEKQQKAKNACEQDKKNGRFHVKFLDWNEVDRGMGWEALCTTCIGRPHAPHARTHARTHYWGRPVGTTGHIQLMRLGTTATAASIGR